MDLTECCAVEKTLSIVEKDVVGMVTLSFSTRNCTLTNHVLNIMFHKYDFLFFFMFMRKFKLLFTQCK